MTDDQKNMWSILIAVLKNKDRDYSSIEEIIDDIIDIRIKIETLKVK